MMSTIITIAYALYNLVLLGALLAYSMSLCQSAFIMVGTVVCLHFVLGAISAMTDGVLLALYQRFGIIISPHFQIKMAFRTAVTILGDVLLLNSLILFVYTLAFYEASLCNAKVSWVIVLSGALIGNLICNLLHIFPPHTVDCNDNNNNTSSSSGTDHHHTHNDERL